MMVSNINYESCTHTLFIRISSNQSSLRTRALTTVRGCLYYSAALPAVGTCGGGGGGVGRLAQHGGHLPGAKEVRRVPVQKRGR